MSAEIIQPAPLVVPPAGESFTDPAFGSAIKRITAALPGRWVTPEYTVRAFNSTGTYLLLLEVDHFSLRSGAGAFIRELLIGASERPRWSRTSPNVLYFLRGNAIYRFNVETETTDLVQKFDAYKSIDNLGEGDLSPDGTTMALIGDDREVFTFDLVAGKKSRALTVGATESLYLDSRNRVLVSGPSGMSLLDKDLNLLRKIAQSDPHKCMSVRADGEPVLIWCCSNEPSNTDATKMFDCNGIVVTSLSDGISTVLLKLPWNLGMHFASLGESGSVIVSTEHDPESDLSKQLGWGAFEDEVFLLDVNTGATKRLAHTRGVVRKTSPELAYVEQSWATGWQGAGENGSVLKIVFGSNMAAPETDQVDTYMISLDEPQSVTKIPVTPKIPSPPGGSRTYGGRGHHGKIH